jgi:hypothetical protein
VVSFTLRPLYTQGKSHLYPLARRLDGPHSRSVRGDEEKNSQPLSGLEPPIFQTVAQHIPYYYYYYYYYNTDTSSAAVVTMPCIANSTL